jgi:hypothetical protein
LDTFPVSVSIESDSLNRNAQDKRKTNKEASMSRTKSLDDDELVDVLVDESSTISAAARNNQNRQENYVGSMDSDVFKRTMERKKFLQENEEAIEKFYEQQRTENHELDKLKTSMERVVREMIDRYRIRNAR